MPHFENDERAPDPRIAGTPADPTLPPIVRQALEENWAPTAELGAWDVAAMRQAFEVQRHALGGIGADQKGGGFRASGRFLKRESSAGRGVRGKGDLGSRTLRRYITAAGILATSVLAVVLLRVGRPQSSGTTHTYTTRTGQIASVMLSDGTRIVLGPQTTVRLVGFGASSRTVDVEGLANFIVSRANGAPFIVRTGQATMRVLGTQFVVRRYHGDTHAHVAVVEGKISVTPGTSGRQSAVVLAPGYVGDVSDSLTVVRKEDNIATETGWLHDELAFNDVPVSEVLEALTRWYGYQFRLSDSSLTRQHVRIALSTRSSPHALAALKQVLGVNLTFSGNTITLTRRTAHSTVPGSRPSTYDVWTPSTEVGR